MDEKRRAYQREYYQKNRERLLAQQRERGRRNYRANPESYRKRNRKARLKKYGLTQDDYQDILDAQGDGCAICWAHLHVRRMVVDHCHQTGRVRGILCVSCNTALGLLNEDPDRILEAANYLIEARSSSGVT